MRPRLSAMGAAFCVAGFWAVLLSGNDPLDLARTSADQRVMPDVEVRLLVAALICLGLAQALLFRARFVDASSGSLDRIMRCSDGRFAVGLFVVSFVTLGIMRYGVLGGSPLTDDEWAFTFHARTLASGALWAPAPPDPVHFDYTFLRIDGDRWYSTLQPGLPALMTPGVWLLDDPFLSIWPLHAALPPLTFRAAAEVLRGGAGTAPRAAGLLVLTSPWFMLTGATVEPYASFACLVSVVVAVTARAVRAEGGPRAAWALGLALGAALGLGSLIRPFEATILAGIAGLAGMVSITRGAREHRAWKGLVVLGAMLAVSPCIAAQLAYNTAMTGGAFTPPMGVSTLPGFWGFGDGMYKGHDLGDAARIWGGNVLRATVWLAGGTLVTLLTPWRRSESRVLLLGAGVFVLLFLPRPVAGVADFGPVYLFALLPVLAVQVAHAAGPAWPAAWVVSVAVSLVAFTPWVLLRNAAIAENGASPFRAATAAVDEPPRLVLVRRTVAGPTGWIFGVPIPRPDLSDRTIFAWASPQDHRDETRARLAAALPGREVLLLDLSGAPR